MVQTKMVMKIMELGANFYDCPVAWQNMINRIDKKDDVGLTVDRVNEVLAEFDAACFTNNLAGSTGFLQFNTDAGHLMFILKYS